MEVILRKTKITKSILTQSLFGNNKLYLGHPNYDILGWCSVVENKSRNNYILLYNKTAYTIVKLVYFKNHEVIENNEQTPRKGTVDDWYFPLFYYLKLNDYTITRSQDKELINSDKEKLICFLREVGQKGQIYI